MSVCAILSGKERTGYFFYQKPRAQLEIGGIGYGVTLSVMSVGLSDCLSVSMAKPLNSY